MATLQLVRVHEPAQVREIIAEAWTIADEQTAGDDSWALVFGKAVDLLSQRIPLMPTELPPIFAPNALGVR